MFEQAVRMKLRYPYKGQCTTEDLWDLNLTALDGVYKKLRKEQKLEEEDSLLRRAAPGKTKLNLAIDVIKHVVATKRDEADVKKLETEKKAQKQRIMEIIAEKQDDSLKGKSLDELTRLLDSY